MKTFEFFPWQTSFYIQIQLSILGFGAIIEACRLGIYMEYCDLCSC